MLLAHTSFYSNAYTILLATVSLDASREVEIYASCKLTFDASTKYVLDVRLTYCLLRALAVQKFNSRRFDLLIVFFER